MIPLLGVPVHIYIFPVTEALERRGLTPRLPAQKTGHVGTITDVHHNIRLDLLNHTAKRFKPLVALLGMRMRVPYNEVGFNPLVGRDL